MKKKSNEHKNQVREKRYLKSYRVDPMYYYLYYACYSIINRDDISDFLFEKYFNYGEIPPREKIHLNDFFYKYLIKELLNSGENIQDLTYVFDSLRIKAIEMYFKYKYEGKKVTKPLISIRIPKELHDKIKNMAGKKMKVGRVVELAIAYHIYNASTTYYDLITFALQHQFKNQEENSKQENQE